MAGWGWRLWLKFNYFLKIPTSPDKLLHKSLLSFWARERIPDLTGKYAKNKRDSSLRSAPFRMTRGAALMGFSPCLWYHRYMSNQATDPEDVVSLYRAPLRNTGPRRCGAAVLWRNPLARTLWPLPAVCGWRVT